MNRALEKEAADKVNIMLVDDQPAKLLSYELILQGLGENLLKANSAQEALEILIKTEVAVILIDVCMPDLDGFELAKMIREHPRFKDTAIIFVSAIHLSEIDSLKGYEFGGVDYVPVPVVAGVLQAKVRVFVDLFRKTRALARLNDELEKRVEERTKDLQKSIAHQELLAQEVDHRARNALTVIQSIVALTPRSDGPQFAEAINGRILAMARAHNLLSESRWHGADLLKLVNEELEPYSRGADIRIDGPPVSILPNVAQNLALALHEMATNAAKYGALSASGGRLEVSWRFENGEFTLQWNETSPTAIPAPGAPGFGSKVIEGGVKGQLSGAIERIWRSDGFDCAIILPAKHFAERQFHPPSATREISKAGAEKAIKGRRVLIIEDEPLISLMTSGLVEDFGAVVLGPFTTVGAAANALDGDVDAVLLDVNLSGATTYEFADRARTLGVPVAFVTGYQPNALPARFASVPVLSKPIESSALGELLATLFAQDSRGAFATCA